MLYNKYIEMSQYLLTDEIIKYLKYMLNKIYIDNGYHNVNDSFDVNNMIIRGNNYEIITFKGNKLSFTIY